MFRTYLLNLLGSGQENALIRVEELAAALDVSRQTIESMIKEGRLPPPIQLGGRGIRRWKLSGLRDILTGGRPTDSKTDAE